MDADGRIEEPSAAAADAKNAPKLPGSVQEAKSLVFMLQHKGFYVGSTVKMKRCALKDKEKEGVSIEILNFRIKAMGEDSMVLRPLLLGKDLPDVSTPTATFSTDYALTSFKLPTKIDGWSCGWETNKWMWEQVKAEVYNRMRVTAAAARHPEVHLYHEPAAMSAKTPYKVGGFKTPFISPPENISTQFSDKSVWCGKVTYNGEDVDIFMKETKMAPSEKDAEGFLVPAWFAECVKCTEGKDDKVNCEVIWDSKSQPFLVNTKKIEIGDRLVRATPEGKFGVVPEEVEKELLKQLKKKEKRERKENEADEAGIEEAEKASAEKDEAQKHTLQPGKRGAAAKRLKR